MRLIDRYILRQVAIPGALALLVFTFLLIIPFLVEQAEELIAKDVPVLTILSLFTTLLPQALGVAIPMALLLGLLMALGRLSVDREIVALQSCGISLWRLLKPVSIISVAAFGITLYVLLVALPNSNQRFREISFNILAERAEGEVKPRVFFDQFPDLVVYVREISSSSGWKDVFLADSRPGQLESIYTAQSGRVAINREEETVALILENGRRHTAGKEQDYEVYEFDSLFLSVSPDRIFPSSGPSRSEREMSIGELNMRIAEREKLGLSTESAFIEIHKKFSIPFACLVLGLTGLGLGVSNRREGRLSSFVVGIVIIFFYYAMLEASSSLGKGQIIPIWLSVWLPNIFFGGLGAWFFKKSLRGSEFNLRLPSWIDNIFKALTNKKPGKVSLTSSRFSFARLPLLGLLDRYVTLTYLKMFLLSACGLLTVFYISTFLDLSDEVTRGEATWFMLIGHLWYATPQYIYYVVPIAVLLASLVTVGLLTRNSEMVVMKACGISLYRASLPILISAIAAAAVLALLQESILGPWNRQAEAVRHVIREGSPQTIDVLNRHWSIGNDGQIYHYSRFEPQDQRLHSLSIYRFQKNDLTQIASRTYIERASYTGQPGTSGWQAQGGWIRNFDETNGDAVTFTPFETLDLDLEPASYFSDQRPVPDFMNYSELRTYIESLKQSGFDVTSQMVALYRKLSFPMTTLIMTLIAIPFAVTVGRRGALYGVGAGITLAIIYWGAMSVSAALGTGGALTPLLAAWTPNILFGAAAVYLFFTVRT